MDNHETEQDKSTDSVSGVGVQRVVMRRDLDCPACGPECVSSVIDTRLSTAINNMPVIKRRRECDCGERFTTYEVTAKDIKKLKAAFTLLDKVQYVMPMIDDLKHYHKGVTDLLETIEIAHKVK